MKLIKKYEGCGHLPDKHDIGSKKCANVLAGQLKGLLSLTWQQRWMFYYQDNIDIVKYKPTVRGQPPRSIINFIGSEINITKNQALNLAIDTAKSQLKKYYHEECKKGHQEICDNCLAVENYNVGIERVIKLLDSPFTGLKDKI